MAPHGRVKKAMTGTSVISAIVAPGSVAAQAPAAELRPNVLEIHLQDASG